MISLRTPAIAAAMATFCMTGYAQMPVEQGTRSPDAPAAGNMPMAMGGPDAQMARMDEQMKVMQAMHDKMMAAKTPEERNALMAEHMKVMQDSMAMMGELGMGGMRDMQGKGPMKGDRGVWHQMMQSMMQMMMDRMPPDTGKS